MLTFPLTLGENARESQKKSRSLQTKYQEFFRKSSDFSQQSKRDTKDSSKLTTAGADKYLYEKSVARAYYVCASVILSH